MSCCGVCYCGRQADGVAACVVGKQMLFCAVAADLVPRHALRRRGMLCYRGRQAEVAAGKHKHRARLERVAFRDCRAGNASRLPPILMPGNPSRISNWTPLVSKLLSWNASRLSHFASHSNRTLPIDYTKITSLLSKYYKNQGPSNISTISGLVKHIEGLFDEHLRLQSL
jgi:hypothetical protein